MLINKPDDAVVWLGYPMRAGRPHLCVTVAYFQRTNGARLSDPEAWALLKARFGDQVFDEGMKKARGGFAVAGDACAPRGQRVTGIEVRARCGDLEKVLHVRGERQWRWGALGWSATEAQPFAKQAIDLSQAYGGAGHPVNPLGRGFVEGEPQAGLALANVEAPHALSLSPHDRPEPVTLGLWPPTVPARRQWLGEFDAAWRRHTAPYLPDTSDARYFDAVSPDQCRTGYWTGDERWSITGMNADAACLAGNLPGLRPRLLYRFKDQSGGESALDLDTVWLLPNDGCVGVLYRAQFDAREIDGAALRGLFVHTESLQQPAANAAELLALWQAAEAAKRPAAPAPKSSPPRAPAANPPHPAASKSAVHDKVRANTLAMHAEMVAAAAALQKSHGMSIDIPPLEPMPTPQNAPAAPIVGGVLAHISQMRDQMLADMHGALAQQGVDLDQYSAQAKQQPHCEATLTEQLAHLRGQLQQSAMPEASKQQLFDKIDQFETMEQALRAESDKPQRAPFSAHAPNASGVRPLPTSGLSRDDFLKRLQCKASLQHLTLKDLDLSGLDLRARDFTGSVVSKCSFAQANLDEAVFDQVKVDNCQFDGASLARAKARHATWTQCSFKAGKLQNADFSHARLSDCDLSLTHWSHAVLEHAELSNVLMAQASMADVRATRSQWVACTGSDTRFDKATLERATFDGCSFEHCSFDRALLGQATCAALFARRCSFEHADAFNLRIDSHSRFVACGFSHARMPESCFMQTSFENCCFNDACLDKALLADCEFDGGVARRLSAKQSAWHGSRMNDISLRGSDLMQASLRRTTLQRVDLENTNLFATDFSGATKEQLRSKGALITRSNLVEPAV
ncbi:MAG: DUF2169 domain-containing protein [Janthinobacterium lividum]